MTAFAALLRAVNLGSATTVRSADLLSIGNALGLARVRTYIASGNLLFESDADEASVKTLIEQRLARDYGRAIPVMVRTAAELAAIRDANPFAHAPGNRVVAILLDTPPAADVLDHARHVVDEEMALGVREIYVRYTDQGMAGSRLVIPATARGTGRNMNTIAKLAALAAD